MFRIIGFILGSAITIGAIFLVIGTPEINVSNVESDQARYDAALEKIREKRSAREQFAEDSTSSIEQLAGSPAGSTVEQAPEDTDIADGDAVQVPAGVADEPQPDQQPHEAVASEQDSGPFEPQWHEFWSPFRSEIAARGFVSQLEEVTGLDYRIVKVKTGVYQVGFAYDNDQEKQLKLSQISAATGLDLPGN